MSAPTGLVAESVEALAEALRQRNRAGRMLTLPAPDERVSHLHMRAVADLLDQWEADDENDNYSKGDAATDLRNALAAVCTCRALPHDRQCPSRSPR